jgi:hypothetical protein
MKGFTILHVFFTMYINVRKIEQLLLTESACKKPLDGIENNLNPRISNAQYCKQSEIYPS